MSILESPPRRDSTADDGNAPHRIDGRAASLRRVVCVAAAAMALIYAASAMLWSAPENAVQTAAKSFMDSYMEPVFIQTWTLFAPRPPTFNTDAWFQYRYDTPTGKVVDTPVYSLTEQFRDAERSALPLTFSLRIRELQRIESGMEQITRQERPGDKDSPAATESSTTPSRKVNAMVWAENVRVLQNVTSRIVERLHPGGTVTQIRVFFTDTQIARDPAHPVGDTTESSDTGWIDYVKGGV